VENLVRKDEEREQKMFVVGVAIKVATSSSVFAGAEFVVLSCGDL
jgi:hypothetical protein